MEKKSLFKIVAGTLLTLGMTGCMTKHIADDPYIWLEEVNSENSLTWVKNQNKRTLDHLQAKPSYEKIRSEALAIMSATDKIPMISFQKDHVYNFWTDQKNLRGLFRRTSYAEYKKKNPKWEIIIDIDKLGKVEGKSWVYQGCSIFKKEPTRCLMMLSDGGKDAREVREFDLKTKSFVKGGFFLPLAKSSFAWVDVDTLLISTDFGPGSMTESGYPREVKLLKRGETINQAKKIFDVSAKDMRAYSFDDCQADKCDVFVVRDIDFYRHDYYLFKDKKDLVKLKIPQSAEVHGSFKNEYYFSLTQDWNSFKAGSLLKAKFGEWEKATEVYVPSVISSFEGVSFSKNEIYLSVLENVVRKVYKLGKNFDLIPFPAPSVGNASIAAVDIYEDRALFSFENSILPPAIYEWNGKLKKIKSMPARFDGKNLVVEQFEATSFDGVKIPYFVIRDKTKVGPQPTLMSAYGGFQISMYPYYEGVQGKVWLTQGGQYVIANIRGGGEFGPKWHEAALKQNRQVAYNDLFAVTEDIIKKGLVTSDKLALSGGSNGGLLAGVALTQRPELYKAIVINVPLLDMIRYHKLPAGASWIGEYGDPEIESERAYLQKYSPYQNLKANQKYPSIFVTTSTFDDRVHPGHARKFGAKLDEYKVPYYYFENMEGGHSAAADINQRARFVGLYYSFLFEQLISSPALP